MSDPKLDKLSADKQAEEDTLEKLRAEVERLKEKTSNSAARLARMGVKLDPQEINQRRDGYMSEWIYENMLTEEGRLLFLRDWHTYFSESLERTEKDVRTAMLAMGTSADPTRKVRPATPGATVSGRSSSGLILPG